MCTLAFTEKNFADELAAFCRGSTVPREISDAVAAILADVRLRGDEAVAHHAAKFDGAKLRAREFRVKPADIAAAAKRLPAAESRALAAAHASIVAYNRRGLAKGWTAEESPGRPRRREIRPHPSRRPLCARRPGATRLHRPHDGDPCQNRGLPRDRRFHSVQFLR